jgi:hypothetical protein
VELAGDYLLFVVALAAIGSGARLYNHHRWWGPRAQPTPFRRNVRMAAEGALGGGIAGLLMAFLWLTVGEDLYRDDTGDGRSIASGLIERPEDGFALTFPDDWRVEAPTPESSEDMVAGTLVEGRVSLLLAGVDADTGEGCGLADATVFVREVLDWNSVQDAARKGALNLLSMPDWAETSGTVVSLPVGQVARIDAVGADEAHQTQYYFTDGDRWLFLNCSADERRGDGWLSIAETFEFLPVEE